MANAKYPIPVGGIVANELTINIFPWVWDSWSGTAQQLSDAGLLPEGFEWPRDARMVTLTLFGFDCLLKRCRPPKSGRTGSWAQVDYWRLTRFCKHRGGMQPDIHQKARELRDLIWQSTAEGQSHFARFRTAQEDQSFQFFVSRLFGAESSSQSPAGRTNA